MRPLTIGDFELSIFSDGTYPLDGGAFFGVVPKVMWSRKVEADARNYVQAALEEAMAGQPVSTPNSRPYGCSVKNAH